MKYPLVSVAIPAYNHGEYIEACLRSVHDQTYPNIELVVIDDGSTDDTRARIDHFLAAHEGRFTKVLVRSQTNRGVSATSNEAIEVCSAEWVHLLGSDDVLHPDKIMIQWQAIQTWSDPDLALVYADADYIDNYGVVLPKTQRDRSEPGPQHAAYQSLFLRNEITNPTVALRREAFLDIGGFDESLRLEDWDCWLRLAVKYSIARVPQVLASYRYHPGNSSRDQTMMLHAMLLTFARFLDNHGELIPAAIRKENYRKNLHRLYRWAKRNRPGLLMSIAADAVTTMFKTPNSGDYLRYADVLNGALR